MGTDFARSTTVEEIMDSDEPIVIVPHYPPLLTLTFRIRGSKTILKNCKKLVSLKTSQCYIRIIPSNRLLPVFLRKCSLVPLKGMLRVYLLIPSVGYTSYSCNFWRLKSDSCAPSWQG